MALALVKYEDLSSLLEVTLMAQMGEKQTVDPCVVVSHRLTDET
jgi:hypothetical protein